eukprot:TRINITY_DN477_c4_g1_i1.p1 TRINITY_DN477_c4_g1~~TRINITY_DN477_c4_g1_i1.p1  ORF type:complete len:495 (-),score=156.47 TRINITY_DN477_c4_g1_i1:1243-2727(-)
MLSRLINKNIFSNNLLKTSFNLNYYYSKGSDKQAETDDFLRNVEGDKIAKLVAVDIDGIIRGKYINFAKYIESIKKGTNFCNVIFGWDMHDKTYDYTEDGTFTGPHTGYPDVKATIDLKSKRTIPWENDIPWVMLDFQNEEGNPLEICPRQLLKTIISGYETELNATPTCAAEYEFYQFKENSDSMHLKNFSSLEPLYGGMHGYSVTKSAQYREYINQIFNELSGFGVDIECLHCESGPGVFEVAIKYSDALRAADNAICFKHGLKLIGEEHEITPCFMAKPYSDKPGSGGHIHQSLVDNKTGKNIFYDPERPHTMSETLEHFIAGQLLLMPEIAPMYCPNVNSYKRLVEGFWAPVKPEWGIENRTTSVRVINQKEGNRVETRLSGADMNPYLTMAAALGSGLYGIANKIPLEQEGIIGTSKLSEKSEYLSADVKKTLPKTLLEATERMNNSTMAREIFGEKFVDHYVKTREWECREYQKSITDWEIKRYMEMI